MRLLHVVHRYRPAIGGVEQYTADLLEGLAARGHIVDVATTRASNICTYASDLPAFERIGGVDVYRYRAARRGWLTRRLLSVGYERFRETRQMWCEPLIVFGKGPVAPGIAGHILRRGHEYDVIHIQALPFSHPVYSYYVARAVGRPVAITPHIHVESPADFDLRLYSTILRHADLVVAQTEREIPYLLARGVVEDKTVVGGCGVKLDEVPTVAQDEARRRLNLPLDSFVALFLGRKERYKGFEVVLSAFAQLHAANPDVWLVTAGEPTDFSKNAVRRYAGLPHWIDIGAFDNPHKVDLLNASDVLMLPSTAEAFGIVFLEAWAARKPVIGARAAAIPWVIDDEVDGLLVDPEQPGELARALERLIQQPDLGRRMGDRGYAKVSRRFTVSHVVDRMEHAYERLLERLGSLARR